MPSFTNDGEMTYEALVFNDGSVRWNESGLRVIRVTNAEMERFEKGEIDHKGLLEIDHMKEDLVRNNPEFAGTKYELVTIDSLIEEFDNHYPPQHPSDLDTTDEEVSSPCL